ncbi:MAG TPA: hypothetical protein VHZ03_37030 [Trebonia sp.]|jgi:hypothetical protein|nr:hypothetical protein [Trebonia sp.]
MTGKTDITAPARLLAVEVLLAEPELLGNDALEAVRTRRPAGQGSGARVSGALNRAAGSGTTARAGTRAANRIGACMILTQGSGASRRSSRVCDQPLSRRREPSRKPSSPIAKRSRRLTTKDLLNAQICARHAPRAGAGIPDADPVPSSHFL